MPHAVTLPATWTAQTLHTVRRALRDWFHQHQRDLPWRNDRDPYRIWVSEVMLQQTTVAAVIPYFERFLNRFPTVSALAAADEQDVLRHWAGLGYYRRARHLHQAAQQLATRSGESLPDDPAIWAALPGVGQYILGAVLSQAFDVPLPIVEANSLRVLARLWAYPGDPRMGAGKKWVWQAAETLLPHQHAGDFNQALMELGALVCRVERPRCGECPLARFCQAHRQGRQEQIPPRPSRKATRSVQEVAVIIRDQQRVLLCQRPPNATRWANLWEFPHAERHEAENLEEAAQRIARECAGFHITVIDTVTTIRHTVTQSTIQLVCVDTIRQTGVFEPGVYQNGKWLTVAELGDYPVSSPHKKLMDILARQPG
ncbi:MAG: A/G-specific adenine glycosylase [Bacteroidales bacterium]|nr:A/G-specific adenine glycosylase [Bacteroidales bacterium]